MEQVRLGVIEDNPVFQQVVRDILGRTDHTVAFVAGTLEQALQTVDDMAAGKIACDAILLDGNLSSKTDVLGDDARSIIQRLHDYRLSQKIIGFATNPLADYGIEVDVDLGKVAATELPKVLDRL